MSQKLDGLVKLDVAELTLELKAMLNSATYWAEMDTIDRSKSDAYKSAFIKMQNDLGSIHDKLFGCSTYNLDDMHKSIDKRLDHIASVAEANNIQLYAMKKASQEIDIDLVLITISFILGAASLLVALRFLNYL